MADFYQTGIVTTLHRMNTDGLERLENDLQRFSAALPVGLVLPALYSEFGKPAMHGIVRELARVRFLRRIVVALGAADRSQFEHAQEFFNDAGVPATILWMNGEPIQQLLQLLKENGLPTGQDGKGRSCWMAYGYLLARGDCDVIALHDCDIINYSRELLARLCYPVANPNLGFEFCKGFYARFTRTMHGRVTRLFVTPLLRAVDSFCPGVPVLRFLDSFRYALAGEFAMRTNLARVNRIPADWGLEMGVLAEVYRNTSISRICQVDLADNYEHKHQELSPGDPATGLRRMSREVARSLFRTLASEGVTLSQDAFRTLCVRYTRLAEDTMHRYYADAMLNGLEFDRHAEELAVTTFATSLAEAAQEFLSDPLGLPLIPNWNRVISAIPDFFNRLTAAVEAQPRVRGEVACAA
jgi:glucosyl-3-phosphoglycerate synthase